MSHTGSPALGQVLLVAVTEHGVDRDSSGSGVGKDYYLGRQCCAWPLVHVCKLQAIVGKRVDHMVSVDVRLSGGGGGGGLHGHNNKCRSSTNFEHGQADRPSQGLPIRPTHSPSRPVLARLVSC